MIQEEDMQYSVKAKVRAQIITHLFKDIYKNLNKVEFFYAVCTKEEISLQFMSSSLEILITIVLKKNIFQAYDFNEEYDRKSKQFHVHKYFLEEFSFINALFENNKIILDLEILYDGFKLTYKTTNGFAQFIGSPVDIDEEDQEKLIPEEWMHPQQEDCLSLMFQKVGHFDGPLYFAKSQRLTSLWFKYNSVSKALEIKDSKARGNVKFMIKPEREMYNAFNEEMEFSYKMLSCAMELLPKDSKLKLTFHQGFMLVEIPEKEKSFTIRLNALLRDD